MLKKIKKLFEKEVSSEIKIKEAQKMKAKIYEIEVNKANEYIDRIVKPKVEDVNVKAFDSMDCYTNSRANANAYRMEPHLFNWYASQGFIGFNSMAIIAQNKTIAKICDIKSKDTLRKGYTISNRNETLDNDTIDKLEDIEDRFRINEKLINQIYFTQVFGIRVTTFEVYSSDPDYYEKPFNIDGVTKNSYKGIKQIDPYFCMPILNDSNVGDPTDLNFYEPEFWLIGGKKYHKSHLIITKGEEVADLIKPSYQYAGLSLTQKIYHSLYNAERTADEVPSLVMTKRTNIFKTADYKDMVLNLGEFIDGMKNWLSLRDNFQTTVIGQDDEMMQLDTSLSDLDNVIMTNFQLVCSTANIPSYKLMGTSLKGFSSGETEESSYHEELESQQSFIAKPLLQRHLDLVNKSEFDGKYQFRVRFNELDSVTETERATINTAKTNDIINAVNVGIISQQEAAKILNEDKDSYFFGKLDLEEFEDEQTNLDLNLDLVENEASNI